MGIDEKIKELRKANNLTQKGLSSISGIAEISIRQYENNKRQPKLEQLQKLAIALGVSLDELAGIDSTQAATITKQAQERRMFFNKYGIDEKSWNKILSSHLKFLDMVSEIGMNEEEFTQAYNEYNEMQSQFIKERFDEGIEKVNQDVDPDAKKD